MAYDQMFPSELCSLERSLARIPQNRVVEFYCHASGVSRQGVESLSTIYFLVSFALLSAA